jgi:hypothetical protein
MRSMRKGISMPSVELLYLLDCPYVGPAREQLRRALQIAGLPSVWREHDVASADAPEHVRGFGSPTVLVDGRDVLGAAASEAPSCRVYDACHGIPPLAAIVASLTARPARPTILGAQVTSLIVLPGAFVCALPVVTCAACWPAYASVLASLGLPFLMGSRALLPVTAVALVVGLIALGVRAGQGRGRGPVLLGTAGAAMVLAGKFSLQIDAAVWLGVSLLVGASAWNAWPLAKDDPPV